MSLHPFGRWADPIVIADILAPLALLAAVTFVLWVLL